MVCWLVTFESVLWKHGSLDCVCDMVLRDTFGWVSFIFSYQKFIANQDLVPKLRCSLSDFLPHFSVSSVTSIITSYCYLGIQQSTYLTLGFELQGATGGLLLKY